MKIDKSSVNENYIHDLYLRITDTNVIECNIEKILVHKLLNGGGHKWILNCSDELKVYLTRSLQFLLDNDTDKPVYSIRGVAATYTRFTVGNNHVTLNSRNSIQGHHNEFSHVIGPRRWNMLALSRLKIDDAFNLRG